jgi:Rrf2 family protein
MSGFLNFSESTALALHAMALLARRPRNRLSTPAMARELGTSMHTLGKVMTMLSRQDFVEGEPGPNGGYRLMRPAAEISLMQICECTEGRLRPQPCLLQRPVCANASCVLTAMLTSLGAQARGVLQNTALQSLADSAEIGWQQQSEEEA